MKMFKKALILSCALSLAAPTVNALYPFSGILKAAVQKHNDFVTENPVRATLGALALGTGLGVVGSFAARPVKNWVVKKAKAAGWMVFPIVGIALIGAAVGVYGYANYWDK